MTELTTIDTIQLATIDTSRIDENPAVVYLASLSPGSRRAMERSLTVMAQILTSNDSTNYLEIPWYLLRFQHTAALRAVLSEKYSFSTSNKMLSALRGTLKVAWKLGLMSAEDYHKAASVESIKGETVPAGRSLKSGELAALLETCGDSATGIRDAAMISLLYACGLRRAELVDLQLADYDQIEKRLKVRGKRNKQRLVPVVSGAINALEDWLVIRGDASGSLFVGTGNRNTGRKLTTQAIYKMLQTRAGKVGITNLSPHDFRRTFVGDLLDAGADIVTVQKLAGHANVETTSRYDRRGERAKQTAVEMLHVPYKQRAMVIDRS